MKKKYQQYLKKADFVLLAVLCLVGVLMIVIPIAGNAESSESEETAPVSDTERSSGPQVVVYVSSGVYGTYPLDEDRTIRVTQLGDGVSDTMTNIVEIENGEVRMESSTCRNQICVDEGWISSKGEMIVCLPNKVIVTIEGTDEAQESSTDDGGVDAIAQ